MVKPWADQPFELIKSPRCKRAMATGSKSGKKETNAFAGANEMALVHNIFIRGLNCIYLQAPNVKFEKDIADFGTFIDAWTLSVHSHHDSEESFYFPSIEEYTGVKGIMDANIEQHRAFGSGLTSFEEYIKNVKEGKEKYDGAKVQSLIDSFGKIFTQHLTDEIETLLGLEKYEDKIDWKVFNKKIQEHAVGDADMVYQFPYMLTNWDMKFEAPIHDAVWPPFPWFVGLLVRLWYVPKLKGAWRFSCCDRGGYRKELEFV